MNRKYGKDSNDRGTFRDMKEKIIALYHNSVIRYAFFGGLTTLVNMAAYFLLAHFTPLGATEELQAVANTIAVFISIVFAFVTNSKFVFESEAEGFRSHFYEFVKFTGARLSTLAIDVGGVYLFVKVWHMNDMIVKLVLQFVVIVLNYFFSKFLVFVKKK